MRQAALMPQCAGESVFPSPTGVTGLQSSMAARERRNWSFSGTLLGRYRKRSLIPRERDRDTEFWISTFDNWITERYRNNPVQFDLKKNSLVFKIGDKHKKTQLALGVSRFGSQAELDRGKYPAN